ncbi:outer membrane lipoprotein-sorting protein [Uliginosibacterium sp. H1]|uniref:outer membrane lipoprotein-sorting protein n=1 Tax=Uliginosibacterium sp. H1 TaxID=3114757 RepID=UPI002E19A356|nr:outer membrane lipoprotein-sorting protein [Uliginosibacterium sp. H1]
MSERVLKRTVCAAGLALLAVVSTPIAGARERTAVEILEAADAVRNPPGSFSVKTQLTEYRQGKQSANSTLTVFAKPNSGNGQYRNLIRFVAPARDTGKLMLRNGMDLWFYDPVNRASVRISPQQRLLGQASNGDVMTTRLARDYEASLAGRESVKDGEGAQRDTLRLKLVAQREDVAYARVDYWVDAVNDRPVMARYYTAEERLLKTAYFRKYQEAMGTLRPIETVIIDGLDSSWVTVMQTTGHTPREIPDEWLQRDYLPRFAAD